MHFFVIFFEKIPPACLDGNPPPFTREANPSGLPCGNPPPFTREAMAQMTEGLKSNALFCNLF